MSHHEREKVCNAGNGGCEVRSIHSLQVHPLSLLSNLCENHENYKKLVCVTAFYLQHNMYS